MTFLNPPTGSGSGSDLRERWRAASLAAGWTHPGDWHSPAVDRMLCAVEDSTEEEPAATRLGADRAARGVGLAEALTDLSALYWVAAVTEPPFPVTRAFAQSWSEVTTFALLTRGATDALTGLGTVDYLAARLGEVYAEERETGIPTPQAWCAIRVTGPHHDGERGALERLSRARVVASVLDHGESNAVLPSGAVVSLARTPSAREHVLRLRHRLLEVDGTASTVAVAPLPATRDAALEELLGV